ncbi:MAG: hypothetical protein NZM04_02545 [Methylacidiphilales bacterium]|nr:hypothetical protein [Candidatus Methylacidiphilales bacterium]
MANVTITANSTIFILTCLDYGTQYYWQVSACNAGGCTPANGGVAWDFKTINPPVPVPFQKTTTPNGAINMPTNADGVLLKLTTYTETDRYEVCMGTLPGTCDLSDGGFQDVVNVLKRYVCQLPFSVTL